MQYIEATASRKGTQHGNMIAAGAKVSSSAALGGALDSCGRFGMYGADCNATPLSFGGGAIVTADPGRSLQVVAAHRNPISAGARGLQRHQHRGTKVAIGSPDDRFGPASHPLGVRPAAFV